MTVSRSGLASFGCLHLALTLGCGGGAEPAASPAVDSAEAAPAVPAETTAAAAEEAESGASEEKKPAALPSACAKSGADPCVPAAEFVQRMCHVGDVNVALYLMQASMPFSRGFLTRKTKAWNASGGASASDDFLAFDEEVMILKKHGGGKGGMQVSGTGGGYEAMRWDGSCVTLAKEELTRKKPPRAHAAHIYWKDVDDGVRDSLREDEKVNTAYRTRRKHCKGVTMGVVTKACEKADKDLSAQIIRFVRGGGVVARPTQIPE